MIRTVAFAVSGLGLASISAEHILRTRYPKKSRPSHAIVFSSKKCQSLFFQVGATIAKISNVPELIKSVWRFIESIIPFAELATTVRDLGQPTLTLLASPVKSISGYCNALKEMKRRNIVAGFTIAGIVGLYYAGRNTQLKIDISKVVIHKLFFLLRGK